MPVQLHWSAETPDLYAASTGIGETHSRIFLVAEVVSDGTWDWAAWSRRGRRSSLHGHAPTREAAMHKAEVAARAIRRTMAAEAA